MKYAATVVRGTGRGKTLGFPTLNLELPAALARQRGIFAGWIWLGARKHPVAFHLGPAPVFKRRQVTLEAFVIDKKITRPPARVSFELVKRLRPVKNFASPAALAAQMRGDVAAAKSVLGMVGKTGR